MQAFSDLPGKLCAIFLAQSLPGYPILIQIALVVSILAVATIILTLAYIFYNRVKKQREIRISDEAEMQIMNELNNHLLTFDTISEHDEPEFESAIRQLNLLKSKNNIFENVLARLLIYFRHNLTGNISALINSAYYSLKLNNVTLNKLKSSLWFIKAKGLKELQDINDYQSVKSITPLLSNDNTDVRIEAYAALLKLQADKSFVFLINEKEELSNWHQILLFESATKSEHSTLPMFGQYLQGQNKSLMILSIKFILHYKQFEAIPQLIELLNHADDQLRREAICALGVLDAAEAEQKLISIYPTERNPNKSQILVALGEIASGNAISFLSDKFLKADHYTLLKSAAAAIMAHPVALRDRILERLNPLDEEQKAMIRHFEDPLIRLHGIR